MTLLYCEKDILQYKNSKESGITNILTDGPSKLVAIIDIKSFDVKAC